MLILRQGRVLNEHFQFIAADLGIADGRIQSIAPAITPAPVDEVVDCQDCYVLPGLIDTHIHGACGTRFNDEDADVGRITAFEATQGVTCIAAATASSDFSAILRQFDRIAGAARQGTPGAKIGGIHAEGPFLNPQAKGAMNPLNLIPPTPEKMDQLIAHGKGLLKLITVAPEIDQARPLIEQAVRQGIKVSLGHTNATLAQAEDAIHWGATQATHTFNAMRPFNHREPGVLGAVLLDPRVTCEMIGDFVHLHPRTVELIYRLKGAERINLVSDSGHAAGMTIAEFEVDGIRRYVRDGVVRLADGTIAGSAKTLLDGVRNLVGIGIPLADVIRMAAYNPACTLGLAGETGSLKTGKWADILVLDQKLQVRRTLVNGRA